MTTQSGTTYLTSRIKEALYNADGNKAKAMQQIMAWCAQDSQLLQQLTRAHLSGIVAYHVDRVTSGRADGTKGSHGKGSTPRKVQPVAAPASTAPRHRVDLSQGNPFGQAILSAANNANASVFGMESYEAPTRADEQTSRRHVEAMRHLASFSKTPQDKGRR